MDNSLKSLTKSYLFPRFSAIRRNNRLTKEGMAEQLHISPRSYSDLERGKYCSSSSVLLLLLSLLPNNEILLVVRGFRTFVEEYDETEKYDHHGAG